MTRKVKTPFNIHKDSVLMIVSRNVTSECIQTDTSIKVLLKDQDALKSTTDNAGSYSGDEVVELFQPPLVNRPLDPVEVKFLQEQKKASENSAPAVHADSSATAAAEIVTPQTE